MGRAALRTNVSAEDYLAFERASEERHEYAGGEVFAMSGGIGEHSLIACNVIGELRAALRGRPCRVYGSDLRIHIPASGRYTYADVVVVCGQPVYVDEARDTLENPVVIVEVLSDSTEQYDRGDKFKHYRSIPSVRDYLLISQKEMLVDHYARRSDGSWLLRSLGVGERVVLDSIEAQLPVDEAYLDVFRASGVA